MKLTQASIAKLRSDGPDVIYYDDELPGFGIRVRAGGSRNYIVRYRQGGLERRHTVGSVSVLSIEEARKKARKVLVAVDEGRDPTTEKATKRASASLLFSSVAADYLQAKESAMKPRTLVESTRYLNRDWKPLHSLPLGTVSRAIVSSHLREIANKRGGPTANRARAVLSAMYSWAIGEGLCETNPVDGTNKPDETRSRDRILSDPELAAIWNAATDNDFGRIVKLLMLTAQRRNEIGELRWSEVNMAAATITLPAARTKNGREHTIPLSADALEVLRSIPHRNERDVVYGDAGGFAGWSAAKTRLDEKLGKAVKPWTLHDLRRTAATRMADSGIQPHVIEAVLNHVSGHKGGVAGVYNRSMYEPEKRAALDTLASYISTARAKAEGANVTRLRG